MGESSAKHLRGASMEDVIFNGSSSRKPVGLASVELVFDNSDGKLGGEYAQYAEISVKRQVSRDGDSKYFLNGTKCRRRDITDIFLGTGLGPRSYAIIEQGMISRLVEAKPEELRNTLEEAAGISRYKERRRETETRMAHTRENLERLTDLRDELDKQLERLDKQAKTAQRFRELRSDERLLDAAVLWVQWEALKADSAQRLQDLSQRSLQYQAQMAQVRHWEAVVEGLREEYHTANDRLAKVQGDYYQAGADIARLEQSIRHQQDLQQRQQTALDDIEHSIAETLRHTEEDRATLIQCEQIIAELQPREASLHEQLAMAEERVFDAEEQLHGWQEQWHQAQQQIAEPTRQAQVEKVRIEQLERQLSQTVQRLQRLQQEMQQFAAERPLEDSRLLQAECEETHAAHAVSESQLAALDAKLDQARQQQRELQTQLDQMLSQRQTLQGQLASLETLQQSSLDKTNKARQQWLQQHGLGDAPHLAEQLQVTHGWEIAVETVLMGDLDAICVTGLGEGDNVMFPSVGITLLATESVPPFSLKPNVPTLASQVHSPLAVTTWLAGIYCAETLEEAWALHKTLQTGESVITRDGVWLGVNWLRSYRQSDPQSGFLQRQQMIARLHAQLTDLQTTLETLQTQADCLRDAIRGHEQQRQYIQAEANRLHRLESEQRSRLHALQQRMAQQQARQQQITLECEELEVQRRQQEEDLLLANARYTAALETIAESQTEKDRLAETRIDLQQTLAEARRHQRECQDEIHELQLSLEANRTQRDNSRHQLERVTSRLALLEQQRMALLEQMQQQQDPIADLQAELVIALERRGELELHLNAARADVQAIETNIRRYEQERLQAERLAEQNRTEQENRKLEWQAVQVREQTLGEQFAKIAIDLSSLQPLLHTIPDLEGLQQKLDTVQRNIQRLGAINLAAIDEYREQSERKQYLDQQHTDLLTALETLEAAIRKIDRETRTRFKDTFEQVNNRLAAMFPRLFGGGECYLEMTGEDLLTTGVAIMARPPGKRLSTIHLMSGGEKALTAIALVFAIFELNPAPFCFLDEVDAPLDEANVGRFCDLVRHMAQQVQFIFITHNKTTMELAENLIGVTMREAGVSRLVSVDMTEAVKLANG